MTPRRISPEASSLRHERPRLQLGNRRGHDLREATHEHRQTDTNSASKRELLSGYVNTEQVVKEDDSDYLTDGPEDEYTIRHPGRR